MHVMNAFFKEVLHYHHHYNQKLLNEVKGNLDNCHHGSFNYTVTYLMHIKFGMPGF